ncbi:acyltransferase [bacterium]|nr:acyltransferase [bacterium]
MENKKRNKSLDILKGFGILFMVMGHASFPLLKFVYMFHMALFFICSGMFFKEKAYSSIEDFKYFIKSKIKRLYIPFVLWNIFLTLIHNFLIKINVYTNNPDFIYFTRYAYRGILSHASHCGLIFPYSLQEILFRIFTIFCFYSNEQLSPTWFLRVLFWIAILSVFIHFILKKYIKNIFIFKTSRLIVYILLLFIGYLFQKLKFDFYGIGTICSCSILFYIGILLNSYKDKINKYWGFFSFIGLLISYIYIGGRTELSQNIYPNIYIFLLNSIFGFIFILYVSNSISKLKLFSTILSYIGKHSLSILLFHYIGFKIITFIQICIYFKPHYYLLASFLTLAYIKGWWMLYTIAGILVPLIIVFVWNNVKSLLIKIYIAK